MDFNIPGGFLPPSLHRSFLQPLRRGRKENNIARNATSYDSAGNVSKQELELAVRTATEVRRQIVAWLEQTHPELLKDNPI